MTDFQSPLLITAINGPPKITLEERLKRCELELQSVLKLEDKIQVYEVELRNLRSIYLEKNSDFFGLVEELRAWNKDVKDHKDKGKPLSKAAFRYHLINSLNTNLREVVNTKDRQAQLLYLEQLKDWYNCQNNAFITKIKRPFTSGSQPNNSGALGNSSINFKRPVKEINSLEDYFNQRRSKHGELDPPQDRIKEYTKKEFSMREVTTPSITATRPGTVMYNTSRPMTQGSFARPSTNHQSARILTNFDISSRGPSRGGIGSSQSQFRDGDRERLRSPGIVSSSPWNYTGSLGFFQEKGQQSNFQAIKLERFQSKEGLEGDNSGGEASGDEQIDQASPEKEKEGRTGFLQPKRKVFNNDFISRTSYAPQVRPEGDQKSTYLNYNPSNQVLLPLIFLIYLFSCSKKFGEIRLENLWLKNRNKAVQEKREFEELENYVQNWSNNKGLMEQEINRKNELIGQGSKFIQIGMQVPDSIPKEELNENNYLPKEQTTEEQEEKAQFDNYLSILKLPASEKEQIAHPIANEESMFEVASKIDQSQAPLSNRSSSRGELQDFDFDNNSDKSQTFSKKKDGKKGNLKQSQTIGDDLKVLIPERPKTHYIPLRKDMKSIPSEPSPFVDIEDMIKRRKLAQLRSAKSKIIGNVPSKPLDEADDEEIERRKLSSLQTYYNQTTNKRQFRPFTSIYKKITPEQQKFDELNEITSVRKGFAKKGIKCSLQTLSQSLSRPSDLKGFTSLPGPGSMLFTNPFEQFGKKKKSSKKKK